MKSFGEILGQPQSDIYRKILILLSSEEFSYANTAKIQQ